MVGRVITSREDDKLTIAALRQALKDMYMRVDEVASERDREIVALTAERDNALQREEAATHRLMIGADEDIRALEIDLAQMETERDSALLRIEELEAELNRVAEYGRQFHGGVNPNA